MYITRRLGYVNGIYTRSHREFSIRVIAKCLPLKANDPPLRIKNHIFQVLSPVFGVSIFMELPKMFHESPVPANFVQKARIRSIRPKRRGRRAERNSSRCGYPHRRADRLDLSDCRSGYSRTRSNSRSDLAKTRRSLSESRCIPLNARPRSTIRKVSGDANACTGTFFRSARQQAAETSKKPIG
jgi:hypothetical protein